MLFRSGRSSLFTRNNLLNDYEESRLVIARQCLNVRNVVAQYLRNLLGGAVSTSDPDNFRGRTQQDAAFVEVGVLRDDEVVVLSGVVPDCFIRSAIQTHRLDVGGTWIDFRQLLGQPRR